MAIDRAVDSTVLNGYFSDIADAIRDKGGSGSYTPGDMPQAIEDLPGRDEGLYQLIAGTASGVVNITLPENSPNLSIELSDSINSGVTSLTIRGAKQIGQYGNTRVGIFGRLSANLSEIHLPDCEALYILKYSWSTKFAVNFTVFDAPKLKSFLYVTTGLFYQTSISEFRCPEFEGDIIQQFFYGCSNLLLIDTKTSQISSNNSMKDCINLTALVLRRTLSTVSLGGTEALSGTPIASGTGYIYVPRAMISRYETATNWSTFAGQFRAIEDYTDDGTLTGEFILPT